MRWVVYPLLALGSGLLFLWLRRSMGSRKAAILTVFTGVWAIGFPRLADALFPTGWGTIYLLFASVVLMELGLFVWKRLKRTPRQGHYPPVS